MPSNSSDAAPKRFSTDDLPSKDRLPVMREVLGRVHLRYDLVPFGEAPVRATFEQHAWSPVSLVFGETTALSFTRTPELIGDGNGDFRLSWSDTAACQFESNGVVEDVKAGDAMLLFNGAVSSLRFPVATRVRSMRISRSSLAAAVPRLEDQAFRRIAPSARSLRLLSDYMLILRRQGPTEDPVLAHRVGQHLIDLTALALDPTNATRERVGAGAQREARLATIRADVLANLSHARLSAKTIAQRHGISDRYVHILFEEVGQSFSRFVEDERLTRAFAMLTDPVHAKMRISDIASKVGIVEPSTFNRAFRRRFGDTPRGVRQSKRRED